MTPHELITMLTDKLGPCGRFCVYCPEDINTGEVKECVEKMYKEIYSLQADKDLLLNDIVKLRAAYKSVTGKEYSDESN
jgi:hypothetical protein